MKMNSIVTVVLLLSLASGPAWATAYKCVAPDGGISFQDQPCPTGKKSTEVKVGRPDDSIEVPEIRVVTVPLPGGIGVAEVPLVAAWTSEIVQPGPDQPPTLVIRSLDPQDRMSLMMTFLPNPSGRSVGTDEFVELAQRSFAKYAATSVEGRARLEPLSTKIGTALVAQFNDRQYAGGAPVPEGEFSTVTAALVWNPRVVVSVSILANGSDSLAGAMARVSVQHFTIAQNVPAAPR